MKKLQEIKKQFEDCNKIKCFEIDVIDKRTGEDDYIFFDIEIYKNSFRVSFVPLTKKQEKSKKIACIKFKIDDFYSLDENLENLYEQCTQAIYESDFYTFRY
jgi:hypothetical protein